MANGYAGRILRVNLSSGAITHETPGDLFYRQYLGGWGFIGHILLKELAPGIDPLGPDNKLIFATGIFTGAPLSGSGRSAVGCKSPVSGGFGEADAGGFFGAELTRAGLDAVIVEGRAERPVTISIVDEKVEIRDAAHLRGKDTWETQEALKKELGDPKTRFAVIGSAGENQVLFAAIIHDDNHVAARAGVGAVMGSKNLKAVAVRGSGKKAVANRRRLAEIARWILTDRKTSWEPLHTHGTDRGLPDLSICSGLPTRNFRGGQFEEAQKIGGETMTDTMLVGRATCYSCVIRCKREVEVTEGPFRADRKFGGPEYETAAAFGSNCGVSDLRAVAAANALCNAHGLDTISAGMMVSFAMECFQAGIIGEKDTGGLKLAFGNAEVMVRLVQMIVDRQGIGDLLASGYEACIERWGEAARPFALHVKGQPLPMHEPRFKYALGLGYAVSPTGADHCHNIHDTGYETEGGLEKTRPFGILEPMPAQDLGRPKVRLFYTMLHSELLKNMIGLCGFVPYTPNMLVEAVAAITGWDTSLFELFKAAERGMALARAYNAREGLTAADDRLPDRFFEAFESGPLAGTVPTRERFAEAMEEFYQMAGWDPQTGAPTRAKAAELGVEWIMTGTAS